VPRMSCALSAMKVFIGYSRGGEVMDKVCRCGLVAAVASVLVVSPTSVEALTVDREAAVRFLEEQTGGAARSSTTRRLSTGPRKH